MHFGEVGRPAPNIGSSRDFLAWSLGVQYNVLDAVSPLQVRHVDRSIESWRMAENPERESDSWTATLVPEPKTATKRASKKRRIPRYHVILWDSDVHTFEYVHRMLRELFGHTTEECHQLAKTVDAEGRAVVFTTTKEHAELKRDQILAYGKDEADRNCKGSMHATIESAD